MKSRRLSANLFTALGLTSLLLTSANAQSPSVLYTWPGTGNPAAWVFNFGDPGQAGSVANTIAGELTLTETGTAGEAAAFSDGGNRVRETPAGPSGGTDLTGLDFLEFDLGHNGAGNINVQFFVQAGLGFTYSGLGPDLVVTPGVNTYVVPLSGVPAGNLTYVRTMGFNARDHLGLGNVTWTMRELRVSGTPLTSRDLNAFDNGSAEGGLQGAIVNFDNASIVGNNGGQNQTGLSHNNNGSGSLQWTDAAGGTGGAVSWGNGQAWSGNTFNLRTTDVSNYNTVLVRISATDDLSGGGTINVQPFFQGNNFAEFQALTSQPLPIDGAFHDLVYTIPGTFTNMNVLDQIGINLGSHTNQLVINVDLVQFNVPEPATATLVGMVLVGFGIVRRVRRH
jgi:PEP-CTERM motif-containing protein